MVFPTFRFNEAIKRNRHRFPTDFMFQLTAAEFDKLKSQSANSSQIAISSGKYGALTSQIAISKRGRGGGINILDSKVRGGNL
jgi:hypothetical protein